MDESSNIGGIIQSKIIIAAAAAVIIAVAGIAAIAVLGNDDGQDKTFNPYDSDSVRLKILGNADGSDAIDSDDVDLINRIIEANSDEDETKHIDWKTQYPFADADNDGDVDADDAALVQKFINKESAKMYYLNYYGNVTYVNYPIGQHIGAEYLQLQILPIIHSYSMLTAIDTTTPTMYGDSMFPGITKLESLGNWREITVETMTKLNSEGKLDTLLQWTGGQNSDYLWDKAYESGIADKVSIVIVPCQGPRCIEGILEVACMLGDQSLSDDYREWYDNIIDSFSGITEKKTVTAVRGYSTDQSTIAAFGSDQGPALWFNEIINFQEAYVGKTNFTSLGYEGFSSSATDEVIVMFQKPASVTYERLQQLCRGDIQGTVPRDEPVQEPDPVRDLVRDHALCRRAGRMLHPRLVPVPRHVRHREGPRLPSGVPGQLRNPLGSGRQAGIHVHRIRIRDLLRR